MLSANQMVIAKKALETMYDGKCTITGTKEITKDNGATGFEDVVICADQPCRLSYGSSKTQTGDAATETTQEVKIFLAPDIHVPAGSHVTVTQHHTTREYKLSSVPSVYPTHQEISFSAKDRWA